MGKASARPRSHPDVSFDEVAPSRVSQLRCQLSHPIRNSACVCLRVTEKGKFRAGFCPGIAMSMPALPLAGRDRSPAEYSFSLITSIPAQSTALTSSISPAAQDLKGLEMGRTPVCIRELKERCVSAGRQGRSRTMDEYLAIKMAASQIFCSLKQSASTWPRKMWHVSLCEFLC